MHLIAQNCENALRQHTQTLRIRYADTDPRWDHLRSLSALLRAYWPSYEISRVCGTFDVCVKYLKILTIISFLRWKGDLKTQITSLKYKRENKIQISILHFMMQLGGHLGKETTKWHDFIDLLVGLLYKNWNNSVCLNKVDVVSGAWGRLLRDSYECYDYIYMYM